MKCLVLIPTTEHKVFKKIEMEGQRPTWVNELGKNPDTKILYYKSNSLYEETHISQDYILCPGNESRNILKKTLCAFDFIYKNFNFDFLFRTNISSYIHAKTFLKILNELPTAEHYSGVFGKHYGYPRKKGHTFCSGSGYFLSKDVFNICIEKRMKIQKDLPDDVAIGDLLAKEKIERSSQPRFDLDENIAYPKNIDKKHFHFRCKFPLDRSIDIKRMHLLHKVLGYHEN